MGRRAGAPSRGGTSREKGEKPPPPDLQITRRGLGQGWGMVGCAPECRWPEGPGASQSGSGPALTLKRWRYRESARPQGPMIPAAGRRWGGASRAPRTSLSSRASASGSGNSARMSALPTATSTPALPSQGEEGQRKAGTSRAGLRRNTCRAFLPCRPQRMRASWERAPLASTPGNGRRLLSSGVSCSHRAHLPPSPHSAPPPASLLTFCEQDLLLGGGSSFTKQLQGNQSTPLSAQHAEGKKERGSNSDTFCFA